MFIIWCLFVCIYNVCRPDITRLIAKYRPTMPVLSVVIPRLTTNQLRWSFTGAFQVRDWFETLFWVSCITMIRYTLIISACYVPFKNLFFEATTCSEPWFRLCLHPPESSYRWWQVLHTKWCFLVQNYLCTLRASWD